MSRGTARREGLGILGLGAAACLACCAGPILAVVASVGVASTVLIGGGGLIVAILSGVAYLALRHRRRLTCATPSSDSVPLAPPTRKLVP